MIHSLTSMRCKMPCLLIVAGLILWASAAQSQVYRIQHCYQGCPLGADPDNPLLLRSIYALSYNTRFKSAQWVAYEVDAAAIGVASSLSRDPIGDDAVAETLLASDFAAVAESGYLRAQYVPLVSFAATPYWREVNYLTNVVARSNSLSQGAWYGLDWAIRNLVNRAGPVFVVTGPIFHADAEPRQLLTDTPHRVPDAFFKVVVDSNNRAAAFVLPQETPVHVHHCELTSSIAQVEGLTGLDLFPESSQDFDMSLPQLLGCR